MNVYFVKTPFETIAFTTNASKQEFGEAVKTANNKSIDIEGAKLIEIRIVRLLQSCNYQADFFYMTGQNTFNAE